MLYKEVNMILLWMLLLAFLLYLVIGFVFGFAMLYIYAGIKLKIENRKEEKEYGVFDSRLLDRVNRGELLKK